MCHNMSCYGLVTTVRITTYVGLVIGPFPLPNQECDEFQNQIQSFVLHINMSANFKNN